MADPLSFKFDPITADFTYICWLGNRKEIEAMVQTWDKAVVERTQELTSWVDFCYQTRRRGVTVYAYANNHYQGHAPATIREFTKMWRDRGFPEIGKKPIPSPTLGVQRRLFE